MGLGGGALCSNVTTPPHIPDASPASRRGQARQGSSTPLSIASVKPLNVDMICHYVFM